MQSAARYREYIRERVKVHFDGIEDTGGIIGEALDEHTGLVDVVAAVGNVLTIASFFRRVKR